MPSPPQKYHRRRNVKRCKTPFTGHQPARRFQLSMLWGCACPLGRRVVSDHDLPDLAELEHSPRLLRTTSPIFFKDQGHRQYFSDSEGPSRGRRTLAGSNLTRQKIYFHRTPSPQPFLEAFSGPHRAEQEIIFSMLARFTIPTGYLC